MGKEMFIQRRERSAQHDRALPVAFRPEARDDSVLMVQDFRPEAVTQRKLSALAQRSPRGNGIARIQKMANSHAAARRDVVQREKGEAAIDPDWWAKETSKKVVLAHMELFNLTEKQAEKLVARKAIKKHLQIVADKKKSGEPRKLRFPPGSKLKGKLEKQLEVSAYSTKREQAEDYVEYSGYAGKGMSGVAKTVDVVSHTGALNSLAEFSGPMGSALGALKSASEVKAGEDRIKSGKLNPEEVEKVRKDISSSKSNVASNSTSATTAVTSNLGSAVLSKAGVLSGGAVNLVAGNKMAAAGVQGVELYEQRLKTLDGLLQKSDRSERFRQIGNFMREVLRAKVAASASLQKSGQANRTGGKVMLGGVVLHPLLLVGLAYMVAKSGKAAIDSYLHNKHIKQSLGVQAGQDRFSEVSQGDGKGVKDPGDAFKKLVVELSGLLGEPWEHNEDERTELLDILGLKPEAGPEDVRKALKF